MRKNQIKKLGNYHFTGKTLGKGHFGFVELALHTLTNVQVAVKIINLYGDKSSDMRRNYFREVSLLKKLNHPGIVKIYETLRTNSVCCLVLEYVTGGDLSHYVREKQEQRLVESEARYYFKQIVSVLEYLHKKRIVHRDLKMENILLQGPKRDVIKVIDFGLSNVFCKGEFLKTKCGSPEYAAPELFEKDCKYGTEVDIWSSGIILYGMLVGQLPFRNENYGKLVCFIAKGLTDFHQTSMKHLSPECVVLLSNILQPDPGRRYSVTNIMSHFWTCEGQIMMTTFSAPVIDPRIKQKVVKTVAHLMELTKSEVNLSVDLRKCDSVFAVYNILLQEELEQIKSTNKIVVPLNIQDYSSTSSFVADKNMTRSEKGRVYRGCVLQKQMLFGCATTQDEVVKNEKNWERKSWNENTCVIGKRIVSCCVKQPSSERTEFENRETETDHGLKRSSLQEMVFENDQSKEECQNDMKTTQSKDHLESVSNSNHQDMEILLNAHKHQKKGEYNDSDYNNENSEQFEFCEECFGLYNDAKSTNKANDSSERVDNPDDQATLSGENNESLISDANGEILSADNREEDYGLEYDERYFRTGRNKNQNGVSPVTCVTFQDLETKSRSYPVQRKAVQFRKFIVPEKKGSKLHTIPSKETVNPSRDLEEAIEERLKPCLKNSAASLRQRPHTANAKISRDSTKSKTMIQVVCELPARPKTAVCLSQDHESQTQSLNLNYMTPSTEKTDIKSENDESCSRSNNNYKLHCPWRHFRKPNAIKVDSWLNDETFKISGQKIHIQDSSSGQAKKTLKTQHEAYQKLKTTNTVQERKTCATNPRCSIKLVVGTGCLKKSNDNPKTNSDNEPAWLLAKQREKKEIASCENCNLTKHESSHAERAVSNDLENTSDLSKTQSKDCKNQFENTKNQKNANRHYKNQFKHSTKSVRFCRKDCVNRCKISSSARRVKSKREIVINKWKTVEKFFSTDEKQTTKSPVQGEKKLTSATHVVVPIVTSRHFLVPHPSVNEINEEELNTSKASNALENLQDSNDFMIVQSSSTFERNQFNMKTENETSKEISKDLSKITNHLEKISSKNQQISSDTYDYEQNWPQMSANIQNQNLLKGNNGWKVIEQE